MLLVRAAPGLLVPKETQPRDYLTDGEAALVPDTAYYRRRITDGDLVEVAETANESPDDPPDEAPKKRRPKT